MKGPGKSHRKGISLLDLAEMFPTEEAATEWFEEQVWGDERACPKCGDSETSEVPNRKPMPYWCKGCRSYFSVRTGTALERSKVPLRKWGVRGLLGDYQLEGCLLDETAPGPGRDAKDGLVHAPRRSGKHGRRKGRRRSRGRSKWTRRTWAARKPTSQKASGSGIRGGTGGKTAVVGAKDRETNRITARVVDRTDGATLQGFVEANRADGATVYTDEHRGYKGLPDHEAVKHSVGEYVNGQAHTQGVESFWSMLKRGYHGVFHRMSPKHLQRYVDEFAGRHNVRDQDTIDQMTEIVAGLVGKRLMYRDLIRPTGRSPVAG